MSHGHGSAVSIENSCFPVRNGSNTARVEHGLPFRATMGRLSGWKTEGMLGATVVGRVVLGTWYVVACHRVDAFEEGLGGI